MYRKLLNSLMALYPTGRAFSFSRDSVSSKIHDSISEVFEQVLIDSDAVLDSFFPDSPFFTEDDCTLWEARLGLPDNSDLDLQTRKDTILRKIRHPGNTPYRQTQSFIEDQLRSAGFDVYVHENTIPYKTPEEFSNEVLDQTQVGGDTQSGGETQAGGFTFPVVANKILTEDSYSAGGVLWATFFIGGANPGDNADVPFNRKTEFRELIMKTKPAHCAAYLLINYI